MVPVGTWEVTNMSHSVKKNFLWNASYQLLLVLAPLVTTPYLSRVLGAEQVGVYSYTYAVTNYFALFATMGMASYGVRVIAACGEDRGERSRVFWSAYASQLCIALPVALAYIGYLLLGNPEGGSLVAWVWGLWVLSCALDVSWLFFGVEDFRMPTERSFVTKLASIVAIFLWVKESEDLWLYCLAIASSYFANQVIMWPFVRRHVDWTRPSWREIKRHFVPNLRLFAPVVAISLYTSLSKIMLGSISGMSQAGFYEYSEKISKMPMAVITALGTVMLPRMTAALSSGRESEAKHLLGESMWAMQAVAMGMTFGIAAVAPEFSAVFFGPGYDPCATVMPIVAVVIPIISASNVIGVQYLLPTFSDVPYTASVCVGAVVNIALNLILLEPLGAVGAAITTVAAELAVLLYQCHAVRKELPLASYLRGALPFVGAGALMYALVRMVAAALGEVSVAGLAIEICAGIVVYAAISLVWCLFYQRERLEEIMGRKIPKRS